MMLYFPCLEQGLAYRDMIYFIAPFTACAAPTCQTNCSGFCPLSACKLQRQHATCDPSGQVVLRQSVGDSRVTARDPRVPVSFVVGWYLCSHSFPLLSSWRWVSPECGVSCQILWGEKPNSYFFEQVDGTLQKGGLWGWIRQIKCQAGIQVTLGQDLSGRSAVFMPPNGRGVPPGRDGVSPAPVGGWQIRGGREQGWQNSGWLGYQDSM